MQPTPTQTNDHDKGKGREIKINVKDCFMGGASVDSSTMEFLRGINQLITPEIMEEKGDD